MNIVIVGAGTVGRNIADYLSRDGQDVTLVDIDADILEHISEQLDVQTVVGHGVDRQVQATLRLKEIDLLLAFTANDETNLIIAWTYKHRGVPRVGARVRNPFYLDRAGVDYGHDLKIDLLISPERLVAREIIQFVDNPAAIGAATYARGLVEMRQYNISAQCPRIGTTLAELQLPEGALVVAITRGEDVIIPSGRDRLELNDEITVIGLAEAMPQVQQLLRVTADSNEAGRRRVVIAGGGDTGLFLAQILERRGHFVKIIEHDRVVCRHLCDELARTDVIEGDATDPDFLHEEHIGEADFFLAVTGDDETNLMSCLLARQLEADKLCCLVNRPEFVRTIENAGIDLALSPRQLTAARVLALTMQGRIHSVSLLEDGKAEIIEFQVQKKSPVAGKHLSEIQFPPSTLLAAVVRDGKAVIPRGNSEIKAGDIVVAVALAGSSDALEIMFEAAR